MTKALEIAVVLSAVDRMSSVFNSAVNASSAKLKEFQQQYQNNMRTGTMLMAGGLAVEASLAPAIQAYADLEESSTRLKSVMLKDGGILSSNFEKVNEIAIQLGNKLPGTTADFQNMFAKLITGGVAEQSILDGVGKAAAYLAIGLKLPYEEAARLTGKLKEATGIADGEMLAFMDTIARVNQLGVDTGEMQYAFSRSAGTLKLLNIQGLDASKSIASVYAQLIKMGASGETVGTGMTSVLSSMFDAHKMSTFNKAAAELGMTFSFVDQKTGQFKGIENMIAQFDRIRVFNPQQRANLVRALLGPGQDASFMNTLISQGIGGFNAMQLRMAQQATLNAKVDSQLTTLKNVWEAATGTFTNALASFGSSLAPELKKLIDLFGKISNAIIVFSDTHPKLMKFIGLFIAITGALMILVGAVYVITGAFALLNAVLLANPVILIIAAIVAVALLIYVYWDEIAAFFIYIWEVIKKAFFAAWEWIKGIFLKFNEWFKGWGKWIIMPLMPFIAIPLLIFNNWEKIIGFFSGLWDRVKRIFLSVFIWVWNLHVKFYNAGQNIVKALWDGIKSLASKPIEAIQKITQKMRDFLPFSPAKEGAFRDLHKVKIIETIANTMRPAPMLKAMSMATSAAANYGGGTLGGSGINLPGNSYGGVTITYSPTISITGEASQGAKESFDTMLRKHKDDLMRLVDDVMDRRERTKF